MADERPRDSQRARRDPRVALDIELSMESEHNFYAGLAENLSASGIFVATHALRPVGHRVELELRLPGSEEPLPLTGEVRWVRQYSETSDVPPGMGLSFVNVRADVLEQIQRFVRNRSPLFFDEGDD